MRIKSIKKIIHQEEKQYYDVINAMPYHNFLIKTNSGYICTHNCNFSLMNNPEKQKAKMMKLITQVDARMKSRFLRGTYLPTINIIASSKDTEQSFLEAYIDNKIQNNSQTTLVVDEPQWVVDDRKDSPIKFYVAIGNKFLANELVPLDVTQEQLDEYRAKGYELRQVPIGYLETFQQNLDEAICSIIGIATASSLKYISGATVQATKTESYSNPFSKDIIEVGNAPDDLLQYSNFFDLSKVDPDDFGRPMFIHLDMSYSDKGDKTGIAGVVITGKKSNIKALPQQDSQNSFAMVDPERDDTNTDSYARDMYYKLVFSVSIKAPRGAQISFAKNRNFIRWLRDRGFAIKHVSADYANSVPVLQELQSSGFQTSVESMDRIKKDDKGKPVCLPYHYLKQTLIERRLVMYNKCDLLTDELIGLERKSDGHIDHTKDGIDSKDQADAVCGAVWTASHFAEEYSYNYGDNLQASVDVSSGDQEALKTQMIASFEEELLKNSILQNDPYMARMSREQKEKIQDELIYYANIKDGIFII